MKIHFLLLVFIYSVVGHFYSKAHREQVCEITQYECDRACVCFDKRNAVTNSCKVKTLEYKCICHQGWIPSTKNTTFHAYTAVCEMEYHNCKTICKEDQGCINKCNLNKKCLPEENGNKCFYGQSGVNPEGTLPKKTEPSIYDDNSHSVSLQASFYLGVTIFIFLLGY